VREGSSVEQRDKKLLQSRVETDMKEEEGAETKQWYCRLNL
jgi:hypothetical protein